MPFAVCFRNRADRLTRVAVRQKAGGNILGDHAACTDDNIVADIDTRIIHDGQTVLQAIQTLLPIWISSAYSAIVVLPSASSPMRSAAISG